jgi:glycine amidinotransferase
MTFYPQAGMISATLGQIYFKQKSGDVTFMMVNSFDEWSPLKEVIVGSPIHYELPELELSFKLFFHDVAHSAFYYPTYEKATVDKQEASTKKLQRQYVEELAEDVDELTNALIKLGVKVHRPIPLNQVISFKTLYWEATCLPALNVCA